MTFDPTFHVMSLNDLTRVLGWAAAEGWNPGLADAAAYYAADPEGFFLARVDGEPVAAISVVNHSPEQAFLGLYLCKADWRGKGIGYGLWSHAVQHAGTRTIGLDGVPEQEANYARSGFVKTGSSLRYVGQRPGAESGRTRAATASDTARLVQLDAGATGYDRMAFVSSWTTDVPDQRVTRVLEANGAVTGFATWRRCQEHVKIGPVIAESHSDALELIDDVIARMTAQRVIIDLPGTNTALRDTLEESGFFVPFKAARMYHGPAPEGDGTLHVLASMELG